MDDIKLKKSLNKYRLPYHWMRDDLHRDSVLYFGYLFLMINELPSPPANVLDAGCGDGRVASEMVKRRYAVTGLDFLETSIQYAKAMVPEATFFSGDLRKDLTVHYQLQPAQFDAVTLLEVYEHIPPDDCPTVLANLHTVLRPGGRIIISVPSNLLPPSDLHYRHFSQDEFRREIEAAGFKIKKIIFQHSMGRFINWLLGDSVERILNNQWLQPVVIKRLIRSLYMNYANVTSAGDRCGRYIAVAET
jgi:2-polyprenyl-3-methyl-5-hydroxy-6-metoxy-1,4-benzoquinol methylase